MLADAQPIDEANSPIAMQLQYVCHDTLPWLISVSLGDMPAAVRFMRRARKLSEALFQRCIIWLSGAERQYQKQRSDLPVRQVGRVSIYAREPFAEDMATAILELKETFPYGYSLVQRYLRAVVQSEARAELGALVAVQYDKPNAAGHLPISAKRYAAYLVRASVALRLSLRLHIPRSMRSELTVYRSELNAMRALDCEPEYFHRVSSEVLKRERQLRELQQGAKLANQHVT